jgi:hypothetical protein
MQRHFKMTVSFICRVHVSKDFELDDPTEADVRKRAELMARETIEDAQYRFPNSNGAVILGMPIGLDVHDYPEGSVWACEAHDRTRAESLPRILEHDEINIDLTPGMPSATDAIKIVADMAKEPPLIPNLAKVLSPNEVALVGGLGLACIDRARTACGKTPIPHPQTHVIRADKVVEFLERLADIDVGNGAGINPLASVVFEARDLLGRKA